jgi:ATP adenylyltransferase
MLMSLNAEISLKSVKIVPILNEINKLEIAMACLFCEMTEDRIIDRNDLAYAIRDGYPVTPLHTLIIPKRHAVDYFDLTKEELLACDELLKKTKQDIQAEDASVDGFNIGMNAGPSAGQTVFHCHIHLIPRRAGDVENPRGGVRHTIPGKGFY